jgi:hypothetical protein
MFVLLKSFVLVVLICIVVIITDPSKNDKKNDKKKKLREEVNKKLSEEDSKKQDEKVLCIIMSSDNTFLERCPMVWDTWAKKCDKALFACNCANFTKILKSDEKDTLLEKLSIKRIVDYEKLLQLPIMELDIPEDYNTLDQKAIKVLETTYEKYGKEFKWFLLVDDDTYVFVENLKSFISQKNPTEAYTYGYNFKTVIPTGYHSGGGGVLFTQESLKRIHKSIKSNLCNTEFGYVI